MGLMIVGGRRAVNLNKGLYDLNTYVAAVRHIVESGCRGCSLRYCFGSWMASVGVALIRDGLISPLGTASRTTRPRYFGWDEFIDALAIMAGLVSVMGGVFVLDLTGSALLEVSTEALKKSARDLSPVSNTDLAVVPLPPKFLNVWTRAKVVFRGVEEQEEDKKDDEDFDMVDEDDSEEGKNGEGRAPGETDEEN
jgi:hypothetical protein